MDEINDQTAKERKVIVIGGGPAGLTAAYELTRHRVKPVLFEQGNIVGGIARTEAYRGFSFDMGGHRFYTKIKPVQQMWEEVLGADFLLRPRLSRIYYNNKFFSYPLKPLNALIGLGIRQAILTVISFIRWQIFPYHNEETFEQWVTNRFGRRLFLTFFKAYTEKVWGISTSELKAEWAAQRIKDLSLKSAITSMFIKPRKQIKSLIEQFHYPRRGPGMLWERVKEVVEECGGQVELNAEVVKFYREGNCVTRVLVRQNGLVTEIAGSDFISSMPVSDFIKRLEPVPADVLNAARRLNYRDFLTVCLIIRQPDLFPDNWIYVHSPDVQVGRIQNFKNWSADMVPDPAMTSLGLEYFCTEGDEIWTMPDQDLVELGKREVEKIGLAKAADVVDGCVFRVPKAYPIYNSDYVTYLDQVKDFVNNLENFQTVGRNGLHRYNNQDHSMLTAMLAVRNLLLGEKNDLWNVNTDMDYQEEEQEVDSEEIVQAFKRTLRQAFPRLDPVAFGLSAGLTSGGLLLLATFFLLLKGGAVVGPHLDLLEQFFPGYSVTLLGGLIGFIYLFLAGFFLGSGAAYARNLVIFYTALSLHKDIEWRALSRFLDYL